MIADGTLNQPPLVYGPARHRAARPATEQTTTSPRVRDSTPYGSNDCARRARRRGQPRHDHRPARRLDPTSFVSWLALSPRRLHATPTHRPNRSHIPAPWTARSGDLNPYHPGVRPRPFSECSTSFPRTSAEHSRKSRARASVGDRCQWPLQATERAKEAVTASAKAGPLATTWRAPTVLPLGQ
jgi:hypothetical protein